MGGVGGALGLGRRGHMVRRTGSNPVLSGRQEGMKGVVVWKLIERARKTRSKKMLSSLEVKVRRMCQL